MCYAINETVEICKKAEGFAGTYYRATVVAAIGYTRYLVRYETRYSSQPAKTKTKARLHLTESVDADEIRPLPPQFSYENRKLNDRVDAYIDHAWRLGRVTRFVDPNFYVRLSSPGDGGRRAEYHCPFYKVRLHLEWINGEWFYCHDEDHGPQVQNQKPDQAQNDQIQKPIESENQEAADPAGAPAAAVETAPAAAATFDGYTDQMFRCLLALPEDPIQNEDEKKNHEARSDPAGAAAAGPADTEEGKQQPLN